MTNKAKTSGPAAFRPSWAAVGFVRALALISVALESKPNGASEAALRTETALGIKSRMISEDTGMMVMGFDIFFMFYSTIFLVLCYMDTHLTTRLVASRYGMSECMMPRAAVLQIALDALDARDDALVLNGTCACKITKGKSSAR